MEKPHYYLRKGVCRQNVPTDGFHGENRRKKAREVLGGRSLRATESGSFIAEVTGRETPRVNIGMFFMWRL